METNKNLSPRPFRPIEFIKLNDKDLFGNAAGEDEDPEILDSYYIDLPRFENFYDLNTSVCIASARKGMGKSALLSMFEYKLRQDVKKKVLNAVVIKTTGNNLLGLGEFYGKNHIYLENYWKQIICKRINIEIGSQIGWAISDNRITLVEAAEIEGIKNKNLVGSLISRMIAKIKFLPVDLEIRTEMPSNWQALLQNYQKENEYSDVWLLIDDIDAKYIDSDEYKNLISSFFSAIRSLAIEVKNLKIRATVRTDVWSNLRHFEDLDKCLQYLFTIDWSTEQLKQMLVKRIDSYVKRKYPNSREAKYDYKKNESEILNLIFTRTMPWGDKDVEAYIPITKLANYRPRWMGQLCQMAGNKAFEKGKTRIELYDIQRIMRDFGKNRVDDLIKEHGYQFADLSALINSFKSGSKVYKYSQLNQFLEDRYISEIGISNIPPIDSRSYNSPEQLGEFLYKVDFFSCIFKEVDGNYQFTRFQDEPDLFKTIENRHDKLVWSVHPIYREFLRIK
jgi:hypothetical protein